MTLVVYFKGIRYDDPKKFAQFDYSGTDIEIKYEGAFKKTVDLLVGTSGFNLSIGTLSGLFNSALLTVVDDEEEDIKFVFESGFIATVSFTEEDEEEVEEEEEEEEGEEETEESEKSEPTSFPLQDNTKAPEKLIPEKKDVKHVPFSKW